MAQIAARISSNRDREDRSIDAQLFLGAEMAGQDSESSDGDGAHLLHQNLGFIAVDLDLDLGSEGCILALVDVGAIRTTERGSSASD